MEGNVAMLQWRATSEDVEVHHGTESFVIDDGLIVARTIHDSARGE